MSVDDLGDGVFGERHTGFLIAPNNDMHGQKNTLTAANCTELSDFVLSNVHDSRPRRGYRRREPEL